MRAVVPKGCFEETEYLLGASGLGDIFLKVSLQNILSN